ncbi:MAG: methyltransferase domain-containing protein [Alteromonadaceae bacterium]|nr:methyltransferase domain-containing protein [Alteromonadaceae bacterium]
MESRQVRRTKIGLTEQNGRFLRDSLSAITGFDFELAGSATLVTRMDSHIGKLGFNCVNEYVESLSTWSYVDIVKEIKFIGHQLIDKETFFNRAANQYRFLKQVILPEKNSDIRVLCVGCGRGHEAYDLAMELANHYSLHADWMVTAIDIDNEALAHAREGIYGAKECFLVPNSNLTKYFSPAQQWGGYGWRANSSVREKLEFKNLDVLTAKFADKFDVIFCRNVLSLMTSRNREIALGNLWQHLSQDGYLILGHNENFGLVVPECNQESSQIAKRN